MVGMARNPGSGGMGSQAMGMGMGLAMANQMAQGFAGQGAPGAQGGAPPMGAGGPPPIAFYAYINGQQAGPLSGPQVSQMVQEGAITPETAVWRQGMAGWAAASQVAEISSLFAAAPPPPPPPPPPSS